MKSNECDGRYWAKAGLIWLAMATGAILNGIFRQAALVPLLGESIARPLSAAILLVYVYTLTSMFLKWVGRPTPNPTLWATGVVWVALTVVFEVALGLATGQTIPEMLAAYSPLSPTLWVYVLVGVLVAPRLVGILFRRH